MGVAAERRDLARVQHGAQRRIFEKRQIGVPAVTPIVMFVRFLDDLDDFRVVRHALRQRMDVEVAEAPGEGLVLVGCQVLVVKEQDEVVEERVVDLRERFVVQFCGEINAGDFGAERTGHGLDVNLAVSLAHGHLVRRAACHGRP